MRDDELRKSRLVYSESRSYWSLLHSLASNFKQIFPLKDYFTWFPSLTLAPSRPKVLGRLLGVRLLSRFSSPLSHSSGLRWSLTQSSKSQISQGLLLTFLALLLETVLWPSPLISSRSIFRQALYLYRLGQENLLYFSQRVISITMPSVFLLFHSFVLGDNSFEFTIQL